MPTRRVLACTPTRTQQPSHTRGTHPSQPQRGQLHAAGLHDRARRASGAGRRRAPDQLFGPRRAAAAEPAAGRAGGGLRLCVRLRQVSRGVPLPGYSAGNPCGSQQLKGVRVGGAGGGVRLCVTGEQGLAASRVLGGRQGVKASQAGARQRSWRGGYRFLCGCGRCVSTAAGLLLAHCFMINRQCRCPPAPGSGWARFIGGQVALCPQSHLCCFACGEWRAPSPQGTLTAPARRPAAPTHPGAGWRSGPAPPPAARAARAWNLR